MSKPFKTYAEQEVLLLQRGIEIDDSACLRHTGYYPIVNGYKDPFLKAGTDTYRKGTKLSDLSRMFDLDRNIRMYILGYAMRVESLLKVIAAYEFEKSIVGKNRKQATFDKRTYNITNKNSKKYNQVISIFNKMYAGKPPYDKNIYLKHYRGNADGIPMWILLKAADFGTTLKFIQIVPDSVRNKIAQTYSDLYKSAYGITKKFTLDYGNDPNSLLRTLYHIRNLRNACAHDERIYTLSFSVDKQTSISLFDVVKDMPKVLQPVNEPELIDGFIELVNNGLSCFVPEVQKYVRSRIGIPKKYICSS